MSPLNISPALEGVRLKLYRAVDHFTDLDVAIGEIFSREKTDIVQPCEVQPDGQLILEMAKQIPLDPRISLIVGDCVHNVRSALDHLVAQLAILRGASDDILKQTFFPICLEDEDFEDRPRRKVAPHICSAAFAKLKGLQPYSTRQGESDKLWILHQLDIIDKHRLHLVAKHKVRPTSFKISAENGQEFSANIPENSPWKYAEDGAELLRFQIVKNFDATVKMHVEVQVSGSIQIEKSGLSCDGRNLPVVLRDLIEYGGTIVDDFGEQFFGE